VFRFFVVRLNKSDRSAALERREGKKEKRKEKEKKKKRKATCCGGRWLGAGGRRFSGLFSRSSWGFFFWS
jgi:hypothetical protein